MPNVFVVARDSNGKIVYWELMGVSEGSAEQDAQNSASARGLHYLSCFRTAPGAHAF